MLAPSTLAARFAVPVPSAPYPVWPVALRYRVGSLAACRAALQAGGVPFVEADDVITVAAEHAAGAVTEFTTAS